MGLIASEAVRGGTGKSDAVKGGIGEGEAVKGGVGEGESVKAISDKHQQDVLRGEGQETEPAAE